MRTRATSCGSRSRSTLVSERAERLLWAGRGTASFASLAAPLRPSPSACVSRLFCRRLVGDRRRVCVSGRRVRKLIASGVKSNFSRPVPLLRVTRVKSKEDNSQPKHFCKMQHTHGSRDTPRVRRGALRTQRRPSPPEEEGETTQNNVVMSAGKRSCPDIICYLLSEALSRL